LVHIAHYSPTWAIWQTHSPAVFGTVIAREAEHSLFAGHCERSEAISDSMEADNHCRRLVVLIHATK
jgi:hypothetical protein